MGEVAGLGTLIEGTNLVLMYVNLSAMSKMAGVRVSHLVLECCRYVVS